MPRKELEARTQRRRFTAEFFSIGFTVDAISEIQRFFTQTGKSIVALTVREILDEQIAHRLA